MEEYRDPDVTRLKLDVPEGTRLELEEKGSEWQIAVTPTWAENTLGRRVWAWIDPHHEERHFHVESGNQRMVTGWKSDLDRRTRAVRQAVDILWASEARIRKFLAITPNTTRQRAILYLFGPGEEVASQVKLAERQCDTRQRSAWREGAVVGAVGGLLVGTALNQFITWLKK